MKKSFLCLFIIILISPIFLGLKFQTPKIYIEPQSMTILADGFGSFDIRVSNVTDLYGVSFDINIPLSSLAVEDTFISDSKENETNFLARDKRSIIFLKAIKVVENRIIVGLSRIGQINGISGSGLLLNVRVKGMSIGTYNVGLDNVYLFDSKMRQIQVDTTGANTKITVYPVDTSPPTINFIKTPPAETNQTLSIEFQWEGKDDKTLPENLVYSFKLNDSPWSDWRKITRYLTPNLREGEHTFSVKAKDEAGNESIVLTYTFRVDITPPPLEITSPSSNIEVLDKVIEIKGKTEPGVTIRVKDITVISDQQTGDFKLSYSLSDGENKIEIKAIDKAGNETTRILTIRYKSRTIIRLQIGNLMAVLNDKTIILELAPFIEKGRTLVPLRFIAESFGAKVGWEAKEEKITITLDNKTIILWVGKREALVNNERYFLEVPPKVIKIPEIGGGRTVVPLRFVSEALGAKVDWEPELQIITITYPRD